MKKGEIFKSPALSMASECVHDPTGRVKRLVDMNSPSEHWRDGLFEIFANGPFHPMCLTSLFCTHGKSCYEMMMCFITIFTCSFLKQS